MSNISDRIKEVLADAPEGLTSAEVAQRAGLTSYMASSRLSKLGVYGELDREKINRQRYRYKLKPLEQPQRITPLAKPGELLKRFTVVVPPPSAPAQAEPQYLAMIRQLPCLKCGLEPAGEAAHVRMQSAAHGKRGGMGRKPEDKWAIPLCGGCHREDKGALHRIGELSFFHLLGTHPLLVCEKLYAAKGDVVRMRAIVLTAIAER